MDSNPGWTMAGEWAFGVPTGGGGAVLRQSRSHQRRHRVERFRDQSGSGDYANTVGVYQYLTTGAIDCSDFHPGEPQVPALAQL